MKKYFQIFLVLFLFSCQKAEKNGLEIDCEYSKKQAQNDFKYKNYIWTNFEGQKIDFFPNDGFIEQLSKNNIKSKSVLLSCIPDKNDKFDNCYETEMNGLLEKKFGRKFFDSLKILGKKEYVLKRKDSIFYFENCDQTSRNPKTRDHSKQFKLAERDFFKTFVYPKNYIKRQSKNEPYSFTTTSFIIMKDGGTKSFETESNLANKKNKIFEDLFNQKVESFVKSISWRHGTIEGIPVNSSMEVTIYHQ